jgi:hypothetical protein
MRGKIIGRPCREWKARKKSAVFGCMPRIIFAPGMLWGRVLHRSYFHARILNIDVSRAKNPLGPRQGAWAHRHMYEEVNDVLSGRGTVSSKIAALIGAKTMSGVFPFLAGISLSIPRSLGAVSGCITTDRSWRISALCISNKMKGSDE